MLRILVAAVVAALVLAPSAAHADTRRWYGDQSLAVEGGGVALITGAILLDDGKPATAMLLVGTADLILGPAVVHGVHGNWGRAAASAGLRAGLVLGGGWIGLKMGGAGEENLGALALSFLGAAAGFVVSAVVDDGFLAYDVTPTAMPAPRGAMIGFSGRF